MNAVASVLFVVTVFEGIALFLTLCQSRKRRPIAIHGFLLAVAALLFVLNADKLVVPVAPKVIAQAPAPVVANKPAVPAIAPKVELPPLPPPLKLTPPADNWYPTVSSSQQVMVRNGRQITRTNWSSDEINERTGESRNHREWMVE